VQKAPANDHFWKHGAGAYKSNIEDFARWAEALLTRKLHTKKLEDVMWQPQTTNAGVKTTWGLGFVVEQQNKRLKISHNGKQEETTTRMVLYPEDGHGVVVMCNCDFGNPGQISTAVYRALAGR
jgi:CubicO group peptidase (beta-lactamase class C family)